MIVSRTVHVASVSATVALKYSFTSQNPASLTCDAASDPAPIATTSSSRFVPGAASAIGATRLAAVVIATVAEPTDTRSSTAATQPSTIGDSGHAAAAADDGVVDPGDVEHPPEAAAGADDEQDAGNRRERFLARGEQVAGAEPAAHAEGDRGGEDGNEHGDERLTDPGEPRGRRARGRHPQRRGGRAQHEHDRQQEDDERRRDGGRRHGAARRPHAASAPGTSATRPAEEACEHRAGEYRRGHGRDDAVEDDEAGIGVQPLEGRERPGMRRRQAVRGRQAGGERQRHEEERHRGGLGGRPGQRHEQDEADAEEHRAGR